MPEIVSQVSALGSLIIVIVVQLIGLGIIFGKVSSRLSHHDEKLIRQEGRLDEHNVLLREHDREIATLKSKQSAECQA